MILSFHEDSISACDVSTRFADGVVARPTRFRITVELSFDSKNRPSFDNKDDNLAEQPSGRGIRPPRVVSSTSPRPSRNDAILSFQSEAASDILFTENHLLEMPCQTRRPATSAAAAGQAGVLGQCRVSVAAQRRRDLATWERLRPRQRDG